MTETIAFHTAWSVLLRDRRVAVRTALVTVPALAARREALYRMWNRARRRPFEPEFNALPQFVNPGDTVLDIGANHGQSIEAVRLVCPQAYIVAFEPLPFLADDLTLRYPRRWQPVRVHPFGLSDRNGSMTVHVPTYNGVRFDGVATTLAHEVDLWLRHSIWRYDPVKLTVDTYQCQLRRLDDLDVPPARVVKIDVQGAEEAVIRGGWNYIANHQPVLLVENNEDNVPELLAPLGYRRMMWDGQRVVPFSTDRWSLGSLYLPESVAVPA